MLDETPDLYDFTIVGGYNNTYSFLTDQDSEYAVRFKPSDYVLPGRHWSANIFELGIYLIEVPDINFIPVDKRIPATIASIINHFFSLHDRVVLYICDDSDSRAEARKRKFDGWFTRFADDTFILHTLPQLSTETERFFASLILRADNPERVAIISEFDRLALGEK